VLGSDPAVVVGEAGGDVGGDAGPDVLAAEQRGEVAGREDVEHDDRQARPMQRLMAVASITLSPFWSTSMYGQVAKRRAAATVRGSAS
jgi:hypothetical protein